MLQAVFGWLPGLILASGLVQSPAPTPRQVQFVDRLNFYTRDGGVWSSVNPDYDATSNPVRSFGYKYSWLVPRVAVRLTIFGRADDGTEPVFWEATIGWDPVNERAAMHQYGTNGTIAGGRSTGSTKSAIESI